MKFHYTYEVEQKFRSLREVDRNLQSNFTMTLRRSKNSQIRPIRNVFYSNLMIKPYFSYVKGLNHCNLLKGPQDVISSLIYN